MRFKNAIILAIAMLLSSTVCSDELMDAIEHKENHKIHQLAKMGVDLNRIYKNHGGFRNMTPVVWAIKNENVMGLNYLLANGASANAAGGYSNLPAIAQVAQTSKLSTEKMLLMIDILMKHGADISATSSGGGTVLHAAAYSERPEVASKYIAYGADRNAKDNDGKTSFELAKMFKHKSVLDILEPEDDKLSKDNYQSIGAFNKSSLKLSPYIESK